MKEALQSVLNQTLPRERYEVLCVVGFKDEGLSRFMRENGVREIYFEENLLGERIALGIEQASGEIVALLEDDDVFSPDKLKCVVEAFSKRDIVYYHNNVYLIDEDSRPLEPVAPFTNQLEGSFVCRPIKHFAQLGKHGGSFNNSSIAVRRSAILPYLQHIGKLTAGVDNAIFYLLAQGDPLFYFDGRKLTGYRLHSSLTNVPSRFDVKRFLELSWADYLSRRSILGCLWDPSVKKWFYGGLLTQKLGMFLWGAKDLKPTLREILELFSIGVSFKNRNYLSAGLISLAYSVSPEFIKAFYRKYRYLRVRKNLEGVSVVNVPYFGSFF